MVAISRTKVTDHEANGLHEYHLIDQDLDTTPPQCVDLRSTTIPDLVSPFHRARIAPVDYLFEDAEKKTRFRPPWSCDLS
jgi:hypothetical protein